MTEVNRNDLGSFRNPKGSQQAMNSTMKKLFGVGAVLLVRECPVKCVRGWGKTM